VSEPLDDHVYPRENKLSVRRSRGPARWAAATMRGSSSSSGPPGLQFHLRGTRSLSEGARVGHSTAKAAL